MPKTITKTFEVFTFEELNESAKERALNDLRESYDFAWSDDWKDSIFTFCTRFGVTIKDWNIDPWRPVDYTIGDYSNDNFRGLKLSQFNREPTPTGYYGDHFLWSTFYDEFKRTGDAKHAFEQAVHAGFVAWRNDWEESLSDDALIELFEANEYLFTADGALYN